MIISHRHKFVFIKTNKTAGTSIEIALSRFCGPEDVITPISESDELVRQEWRGRSPQNYAGLTNHSHSVAAREQLGPDRWNQYFKFCFERNPWDRTVSLYFWRHSSRRMSFKKFVQSDLMDLLVKRGRDLYTENGELQVDRICTFERLQADVDRIGQELGLASSIPLPHTKKRVTHRREHYSTYYDDETRAKVGARFSDEISRHAYQFESS